MRGNWRLGLGFAIGITYLLCVACGGVAQMNPSGSNDAAFDPAFAGSGGRHDEGADAGAPAGGTLGTAGMADTLGGASNGGALGTSGSHGSHGGAGGNGRAGSGAANSAGAAPTGGGSAGHAGDASAGSAGALEAGAGGASSGPRALTRVVNGGPWLIAQQTTGMAVDAQGRVFVSDQNNIYVVVGDTISLFLAKADVDALVDIRFGNPGFQDLDIGPDQQLYMVVGRRVLRTSTAHQATLWRDLATSYPSPDFERLAVVDTDHVALATSAGLVDVTATNANLVYDATQLNWASACATEDFSASRSGVFLYQPGCNGSPLVRGNVDGSGVGILYKTQYEGLLATSNFVCSARDPKGGFFVVARGFSAFTLALYHLSEDSDQVSGVQVIDTVPTLEEAQNEQADPVPFSYGAIAAGPDGSVYYATAAQLWRIAPN